MSISDSKINRQERETNKVENTAGTDMVEIMLKANKEDTQRLCVLVEKLAIAIEGTDCTYRDVICALDIVKANYEEKGRDLLDDYGIQEVVKHGELSISHLSEEQKRRIEYQNLAKKRHIPLSIAKDLCDNFSKQYVIIVLSHHSPRCWKRPRQRQGVGKADGARSDG